MKTNMKKLTSLLLALVMVFSLNISVFAANTDTNFTVYGTSYTTRVTPSDEVQSVRLRVAPANDKYAATYYDTEAAAKNVQWSVVAGSTSGVSIVRGNTGAEKIAENQYVACAEIAIAPNAKPGVASILAKNSLNEQTMNLTIVIEGAGEAKTGVTVEFYNQESKEKRSELHISNAMTVSPADKTKYSTAMDAIRAADAASDAFELTIVDSWGTQYLKNGTFGELELNEHTDENYNYYGWQYAIYHNGEKQDISTVVGAGDCGIQSDDVVVCIYGMYGDVSFPAQYSALKAA